ncbi:MAG: hypothetical protein CBC74_006635 [Crocinitomicaceae bacterium TMED114]|nr:MAG: hypothetical protein CBC74_006635 [Crocinitomicaceae bacterium TMED114]
MQNGKKKRIRWDRMFMVLGGVVVASFGIAAMVPGGAGFEDTETEGRVALSSQLAPSVELTEVESEVSVPELQVAEPEAEAPPLAEVEAPKAPEAPAPTLEPTPSGPLPRKGIKPCSCSKRTMKLARNPYTAHQKRARSLPGSFFVKNQNELAAGAGRGDLIRIPRVGRGFHLDRLTHSEPFLLKGAKDILKEMANRFADAMEGTPDEGASIRITSLTRTQKQQRRLRRRNSNAYNGQSTHNYGASFDIAFIDRPTKEVSCGGPSWALQTILQDMQEKGLILVIPEGNCMHITPR